MVTLDASVVRGSPEVMTLDSRGPVTTTFPFSVDLSKRGRDDHLGGGPQHNT